MIFRCFANSIEKPDGVVVRIIIKEEELAKYLFSRSELTLMASATHDDKKDVGG